MTKTSLIERMEKKGAPKTWIKEVEAKDRKIKELFEILEEYLDIIDMLARQVDDETTE